ncbi:hypothetical protein CI238_11611, partial [Colletotrichum incanum]
MPLKAALTPTTNDAALPLTPKTTRKYTGGAVKPPAIKKAKGKKRTSRSATRIALYVLYLTTSAASRVLRPNTRTNAAITAPIVIPALTAATFIQPAATTPAAYALCLLALIYLFLYNHTKRFITTFKLFTYSYTI